MSSPIVALDALTPDGDLVVVEGGAPLLEEELIVREGNQAMAGSSYSLGTQGENLNPQATSPLLVGGKRRTPVSGEAVENNKR